MPQTYTIETNKSDGSAVETTEVVAADDDAAVAIAEALQREYDSDGRYYVYADGQELATDTLRWTEPCW